MEQSSQGVNPIEWRTEDSAPCSMKKCTLLFATGSNQKYGFPYSLHREVAAVVVAAVPQMLAWWPRWSWPLCCKCISGMPILYHMMALRLLGYLKSIAFSSLLGSV